MCQEIGVRKFIMQHWLNPGQSKIPDINSGLRIIEKRVCSVLASHATGFLLFDHSTFALMKGNYAVKWVPITVQARKGRVRQAVRHGPETMMLMLRLTVLFEPLRVFLFVTFVLFRDKFY